MSFDPEFAEQLTARFREGNPDEKYKRKPVVSRRELVAGLYEDIMAKRSAGYSVEGIAAYFGTLGAPIKVSTLKSYLMRYGHRHRPGQKVGGGQPRKRTRANTPGRLLPDQAFNRKGGAPTDGAEAEPDATSTPVIDPAAADAVDSGQKLAAASSKDAPVDSLSAAPVPPSRTADDGAAMDSAADAAASTPKPREAVVGKDEVSHSAPALEGDKPAGDAVTVRRPPQSGIAKIQAGFGNIGFVPRR